MDAAGLQPPLSNFCLEVFADMVDLRCFCELASRAVLVAAGMAQTGKRLGHQVVRVASLLCRANRD
jgi:hypothetical protein